MANTAANVVAGHPLVTGGLLWAPTGTALATDAVTALNGSFVGLGYLADDGVEKTIARDTDQVTAWGTDIVLVNQTKFGLSFQFTLIEAFNTEALKAVYGSANVSTTAANGSHGAQQAAKINALQLDHKSWVFEIKPNALKKARIVVPDGQLIEVSPVKISDADVLAYEVTLQGYPNSSGDSGYFYTDDGVTV